MNRKYKTLGFILGLSVFSKVVSVPEQRSWIVIQCYRISQAQSFKLLDKFDLMKVTSTDVMPNVRDNLMAVGDGGFPFFHPETTTTVAIGKINMRVGQLCQH